MTARLFDQLRKPEYSSQVLMEAVGMHRALTAAELRCASRVSEELNNSQRHRIVPRPSSVPNGGKMGPCQHAAISATNCQRSPRTWHSVAKTMLKGQVAKPASHSCTARHNHNTTACARRRSSNDPSYSSAAFQHTPKHTTSLRPVQSRQSGSERPQLLLSSRSCPHIHIHVCQFQHPARPHERARICAHHRFGCTCDYAYM